MSFIVIWSMVQMLLTLVPVLSARAMLAKAAVALASRPTGGWDIRQN